MLRIWIVLMLLTAAAWAVGIKGWSGDAVAAAVLATTFIKGQLLVDHYLGLACVRGPWRWLLSAWLVVVLGAVGMAFHLARGAGA
ncbi:cytochrome C oxidase subunit IV family protein [Plasticicumulans sp.]|uniref:cytochrome C oxidase subunit IV family protein n=1 Tax=Plasticicumulans sp. TaxID=2307179 RepID=UPI002CDE885B|nr:cytochrome C oxidase subunit IV family protein [Plasticicumulans sp.]MBS0602643.1 cytochrome C oxidase subunit IV family protein [Pseudomonadota bacterium]HMV39462.1 cytochrome C oxidase subunit IV family protein [Plasticicumulans sp.]HMW29548.1 cytochrome C oxidase subunit IV family protein [Plasticicumulans sp.]HMW41447.1 cytochrome C oxidase subunit IV family protein [Plasticicumulans sp.]HMX52386.1 cytochrome C oxidase subunit IV family protein [Plasticicumulans sp.]